MHTTGQAAGDAVRAGVDSIEHGPTLDAAALERMAARGTPWVPTLWAAIRHMSGVPDPVVAAWRRQIRAGLALARQLGVPILAGSDETPAGELHREVLELVRTGGLSADEALEAASSAARRALDLPGKPGDLVTYHEDPRADITALAHPAAVVLGGVRVA